MADSHHSSSASIMVHTGQDARHKGERGRVSRTVSRNRRGVSTVAANLLTHNGSHPSQGSIASIVYHDEVEPTSCAMGNCHSQCRSIQAQKWPACLPKMSHGSASGTRDAKLEHRSTPLPPLSCLLERADGSGQEPSWRIASAMPDGLPVTCAEWLQHHISSSKGELQQHLQRFIESGSTQPHLAALNTSAGAQPEGPSTPFIVALYPWSTVSWTSATPGPADRVLVQFLHGNDVLLRALSAQERPTQQALAASSRAKDVAAAPAEGAQQTTEQPADTLAQATPPQAADTAADDGMTLKQMQRMTAVVDNAPHMLTICNARGDKVLYQNAMASAYAESAGDCDEHGGKNYLQLLFALHSADLLDQVLESVLVEGKAWSQVIQVPAPREDLFASQAGSNPTFACTTQSSGTKGADITQQLAQANQSTILRSVLTDLHQDIMLTWNGSNSGRSKATLPKPTRAPIVRNNTLQKSPPAVSPSTSYTSICRSATNPNLMRPKSKLSRVMIDDARGPTEPSTVPGSKGSMSPVWALSKAISAGYNSEASRRLASNHPAGAYASDAPQASAISDANGSPGRHAPRKPLRQPSRSWLSQTLSPDAQASNISRRASQAVVPQAMPEIARVGGQDSDSNMSTTNIEDLLFTRTDKVAQPDLHGLTAGRRKAVGRSKTFGGVVLKSNLGTHSSMDSGNIESMMRTAELQTSSGKSDGVRMRLASLLQASFSKAPTKDFQSRSTSQDSSPQATRDTLQLSNTPSDHTQKQEEAEAATVQPCWHEVTISAIHDAVTNSKVILIEQKDVTERSILEQRIMHVTEVQLSLLEKMFPRHVLERLASGVGQRAALSNDGSLQRLTKELTQEATNHACVTIMFTDIVGFTSMSKEVEPTKVMNFLNELFSKFDALCAKHKVSKVETAGDCYIVCGGLLKEDEEGFQTLARDSNMDSGSRTAAARRVLSFALEMMHVAKTVLMPHNGLPVQQRVGIHSGPVAAGLIGSLLPKFSLFGDTMNTASRMESTSKPGRIQVSEHTYKLLKDSASRWEETGGVEVKGKGVMNTFLLKEEVMAPTARNAPSLLDTTQAIDFKAALCSTLASTMSSGENMTDTISSQMLTSKGDDDKQTTFNCGLFETLEAKTVNERSSVLVGAWRSIGAQPKHK